LAGLADVDAITVTAASLADTTAAVAVAAILIAAAVNTLVKIGLAASLGMRDFARSIALLMAAILAAGAAGFALAALV
jgi:uncharacterized membrane protein (DUF4010 family)